MSDDLPDRLRAWTTVPKIEARPILNYDLAQAAATIDRLTVALKEANEYAARYDAVMETMSIDFEDMLPDWAAPSEETTT